MSTTLAGFLDLTITTGCWGLAAKETQEESFQAGEEEILIANHDNESKACRDLSLLIYVSSQAQQTLTVLTNLNTRSKKTKWKGSF